MTRLDELWDDYQETLPRLDAARKAHDEAFRASNEAYQRWITAGGEHKNEPGYGKREVPEPDDTRTSQ